MPLSRRLPKRGFKNPSKKNIAVVNIKQLKIFASGSIVDNESLKVAGLVNGKVDGVKILGNGEIDYPLSVKVDMVSLGARQKIEAAGGTVVEVI